MPDIAKLDAVTAKLSGESESAPEPASAPPLEGGSGADSASADGVTATIPSAGAIDYEGMKAKLEADRERRAERARAREAREASEVAKRERAEAEQAKKEALAERDKWKSIGKDKSWLEAIKEAGRDPRQVYEEMTKEALTAGTPEAKLEAMQRAWDARHEALSSELKAEREAREQERQSLQQERQRQQQQYQERQFQHDFERSVARPEYEGLLEEYPAEHLFAMAARQRSNPEAFVETARSLGVRMHWEEQAAAKLERGEELTDEDSYLTMTDILNVFAETQKRHFARLEEQRRKKQAASQTAPGAPASKSPVASRPTVNGASERKAGQALGNQLAATTAAEGKSLKGESREERMRRLAEKYG